MPRGCRLWNPQQVVGPPGANARRTRRCHVPDQRRAIHPESNSRLPAATACVEWQARYKRAEMVDQPHLCGCQRKAFSPGRPAAEGCTIKGRAGAQIRWAQVGAILQESVSGRRHKGT